MVQGLQTSFYSSINFANFYVVEFYGDDSWSYRTFPSPSGTAVERYRSLLRVFSLPEAVLAEVMGAVVGRGLRTCGDCSFPYDITHRCPVDLGLVKVCEGSECYWTSSGGGAHSREEFNRSAVLYGFVEGGTHMLLCAPKDGFPKLMIPGPKFQRGFCTLCKFNVKLRNHSDRCEVVNEKALVPKDVFLVTARLGDALMRAHLAVIQLNVGDFSPTFTNKLSVDCVTNAVMRQVLLQPEFAGLVKKYGLREFSSVHMYGSLFEYLYATDVVLRVRFARDVFTFQRLEKVLVLPGLDSLLSTNLGLESVDSKERRLVSDEIAGVKLQEGLANPQVASSPTLRSMVVGWYEVFRTLLGLKL